MTDKPDDPRKPRPPGSSPRASGADPTTSGVDRYPPPQFAPAAPSDAFPPPQFAPAAPSDGYPPPQFAPAAAPPPQFAPAAAPPPRPEPPIEPPPAAPSSNTSPEPRGSAVEELASPPEASGRIALEHTGSASARAVIEPATAVASARIAAPHRPSPAVDEPLLPTEYDENDLRAAVGSPPMPEHIRPKRTPPPGLDDQDDDDDGPGPRRRKAMLVITASAVVGIAIASLVVLGRLNSARYAIGCEAKQVVAEQGRSFPPWGTSRLEGDAWKPISIPPNFQCVGAKTESLTELGDAFRKMLISRADAMLTAREVVQIDDAAAMLEQALLHARSDSEEHKSARQEIQRMLGDVGYWKASAKLREAAATLTEAAKEFETAAAQLPRHVSDANAWATYVRKLAEDLRAGPAGAKQATSPAAPTAPPTERPAAPPGVALPVEPAAGSGAGSAPEPPPAPPDAGVPTGGVLL